MPTLPRSVSEVKMATRGSMSPRQPCPTTIAIAVWNNEEAAASLRLVRSGMKKEYRKAALSRPLF
jgi:hypothetical protein